MQKYFVSYKKKDNRYRDPNLILNKMEGEELFGGPHVHQICFRVVHFVELFKHKW